MIRFDQRNITPMLIGTSGEAFDSDEYIYELKLDGVRCLVYLDDSGVELRNKRHLNVSATYPELASINKQVRGRCILDGELVVIRDGVPDFSEIQRRSLMSDPFKINLAAGKLPVSFTAFDILFSGDEDLTRLPLMERKERLKKAVRKESDRLAVSRYIERDGVAFYALAKSQDLEGIVAKQRDSIYIPGKRTHDWIKIKNLLDDDFVVCGWIPKDNHMYSLVLGQYDSGELVYKGHVTLGVSGPEFARIRRLQPAAAAPLDYPSGHGNDQAIWLPPVLVCTVRYMELLANGSMRQPVFKGLREDKPAKECTVQKQP